MFVNNQNSVVGISNLWCNGCNPEIYFQNLVCSKYVFHHKPFLNVFLGLQNKLKFCRSLNKQI